MSKQLTVMIAPMEGVGHVNATIGVAECLKDRGHRVIYAIAKPYEGKLVKYGFEEVVLEDKELGDKKPGERAGKSLKEKGIISGIKPIEKMKIMVENNNFGMMFDQRKSAETQLKEAIEKFKSDIFIIDDFIGLPSIVYSGKPWVFLGSAHPAFYIGGDDLPPGGSGLPTNGDKNDWQEFKKVRQGFGKETVERYNQWMTELKLPTLDQKTCLPICVPVSPYLNIYGYPEELDYTDIRPIPDKWVRVDAFTRKGEEEFELPEKLKNRDEKTQKLIYLSLGSMGSIDVDLMKRLVSILAKSPHKFIVSKGILGDEYELADNMWGQNSVPQTKVLPLVDLVITHGGNNSVTETFSFGKPMIIMPLFADQYDNAQRVHEKGYGIRLEPYSCSEQELLDAIEKLLNDNELKDRLKAAVKRIAKSDSLVKAVEQIEALVE